MSKYLFFTFLEKEKNSTNPNTKEKKTKEKQPLYLKDYERKRLLEKGSKAYLSDSEEEEEEEGEEKEYFIDRRCQDELTYNEEQEALRKRYVFIVNA